MKTAVGLSVFDRPELTRRVFDAVARARPNRLFVFADGPRSPEEADLCSRARAVTENVDWDCDVRYDVAEVNLGARRRYASGVDWIFSHVDEAIFLEDDCVPDPTFFPFCVAMLERYRDDDHVMMVSGSNYPRDVERRSPELPLLPLRKPQGDGRAGSERGSSTTSRWPPGAMRRSGIGSGI